MTEQTIRDAMKAIYYCIAVIYCKYAPEASEDIIRTVQTLPDLGRDFIAVRHEHVVKAATSYGKGEHDPDNPWDACQRSLAGKLHVLLGIYAVFLHELKARKGGEQ